MANRSFCSTDIIPAAIARTLPGLFRERVRRSPNLAAYRYHDRITGCWQNLTWKDVARQVVLWQAALEREHLSPGDRVALLLPNHPAWVVFDQAALGLGLVVVPLYANDRPQNVGYIVRDSRAKVLLLPDISFWQALDTVRDELDSIERIILLETANRLTMDARLVSAKDWLPQYGGELRRKERHCDELATIVYTSGTTGDPKGVMLSHRNILSNAYHSLQTIPAFREDQFLSFLPLSHMLERTAGYYLPMMAGSCVAFARSIPDLAEDMMAVQPSVMISVPRIFERIHTKIIGELDNRPVIAKHLFRLAVHIGWRRFLRQQKRASWTIALLLWPLLEVVLARKLTSRFGGRLRLAVCGGAALSPEVARVFIGLGLPVVQGYGMTETSPVIAVNPLNDNIPESVGIVLPGTEARVGANDELLVKGPGVMLGYWQRAAATADIIDDAGWLHTGDRARIEKGHIYITGRIKDIIVLANGEKISPADMEAAMELHPLIDQAMIVGEGRPYLAALLVLDKQQWQKLSQQLSLDPLPSDALTDDAVHDHILNIVSGQIFRFPGYAQIRRLALLLDPWTIDDGLLTPTLKLRRGRIIERHAPIIECLYEGH